jgi:hypothetical protein
VRVLLLSVAVAAGGLAWGAWRAHTRASVHLQVHDHAGRTDRQLWREAVEASVRLHDGERRLRAEAQLEPPHGLPRWLGPAGEAVDCRPSLAREAWQTCFEAQSRWVARWASQIEHAQVTIGACRLEDVPVARRTSHDGWLWWVPLPHVGGSARCAPATAP